MREIVRASPTILYPIIEKNCPELHKILNPRGGKVPREYLGKLFARDVDAIGKKVAGQIMREKEKALPKLARQLLGLDGEAAKLIGENVLKKSGTIIAKSPEAFRAACRCSSDTGTEPTRWMPPPIRWPNGLAQKLQIIHNTAFGRANLMAHRIPADDGDSHHTEVAGLTT